MEIDKTIQDVNLFIENERDYYDSGYSNLFSTSCTQFLRYLEFLAVINTRFKIAQYESSILIKKITQLSKNIGVGPRTSELNGLLRASYASNSLLHLETESFFIFAKIYLDKIAQFIENYFGNQRGMSLQSHTKLNKKFTEYASIKKIKTPKVLFKDIEWFNSIVTHARDKQIMHQKNPRSIFATSFNSINSASITTIQLYNNENDKQTQSPNIDEVAERLISYTHRLMRLIKNNRSITRYTLKSNKSLNR